jgi:hypothetical protein
MRPATLAIAAALLLSSASAASASAAAPAAPANPALNTTAGAPTAPAIDAGQLEDPNIDRGLLFPTGQTQPARTLTLSDYEIFVAGLTYGITNRLQVSAIGTLVDLGSFGPSRIAGGNLKAQVLRHRRLRLSVLAGALFSQDQPDIHHHARPEGVARVEEDAPWRVLPFGGFVASGCLDLDCHSLLSGNVHLAGASDNGHESGSALVYSASLVARLSEHLKLILEYSNGTNLRSGDTGSALAAAALRGFNRHFAFEAGAVGVVDSDSLFPLLYVSASVRF